MAEQRFKTTLEPAGEGGAWTGIFLTEEQSAKLGKRGRVAVVLTINGHALRAFAAPMGDGTHGIVVNKKMQAQAGVDQNEVVDVTLEIDTTPRTVDVPPELAKELDKSKKAKEFFGGLAYTHQKDFVSWIIEAKRSETKEKRLAESMCLLEAGIKWKDR